VKIAEQNEHPIIANYYSVTEILNGIREINLFRKYNDELTQDIADMLSALFGTAVHHILELANDKDVTEFKIEHEIRDGYFLTGRFDVYNKDTFTIEDYKTCKAYKIIKKDFEDWRKQGLMYAWLMRKNGIFVSYVKFYAMIKDWSKNSYTTDYPESMLYVYEFEVTTDNLLEIEEFINARFDKLISCEDVLCTESERWTTETKWAQMKRGNKRAVKIFDEPQMVEEPYYMEERPGEDKKCDNYCAVKEYCEYWRKTHGNPYPING